MLDTIYWTIFIEFTSSPQTNHTVNLRFMYCRYWNELILFVSVLTKKVDIHILEKRKVLITLTDIQERKGPRKKESLSSISICLSTH